MSREIWVKNLNNNQLDVALLRQYYLEDEINLGAQVFDSYFIHFLNVNYLMIQKYIINRFNIQQLLNKNSELICFV